jgi:hypothetical protein
MLHCKNIAIYDSLTYVKNRDDLKLRLWIILKITKKKKELKIRVHSGQTLKLKILLSSFLNYLIVTNKIQILILSAESIYLFVLK